MITARPNTYQTGITIEISTTAQQAITVLTSREEAKRFVLAVTLAFADVWPSEPIIGRTHTAHVLDHRA